MSLFLQFLFFILQDYKKRLLESKPQIISTKEIRTIFYKIPDIFQCHQMFNIKLLEVIPAWDQKKIIGDTFKALVSYFRL